MTNIKLENISPAQQKRLSHIDFRVNFLGSIARHDLMNRFGIKQAAATRDITEYRKLVEENLDYDQSRKIYTRTENFKPLFDYSVSQVLTALSEGFGEDFIGNQKPMITCETPFQLNLPSIKVLSVLSRAIHQKKAVHITYRSIGSGEGTRVIVPFAMVNNGERWHVRAYDRKHSRFMDCVITRISHPILLDDPIEEQETREFDKQWNRIVELEIVAHPHLENPETVEFEYGMKDKVLKISIRASSAGYFLRRWNIDCSEDHSEKDDNKGDEIYLWLRNSAALYGVSNMLLTPGYQEKK